MKKMVLPMLDGPAWCVCGGEGPPRGYTTVLPSLGNRRKPPGDMGVGGGGGWGGATAAG